MFLLFFKASSCDYDIGYLIKHEYGCCYTVSSKFCKFSRKNIQFSSTLKSARKKLSFSFIIKQFREVFDTLFCNCKLLRAFSRTDNKQ